MIKLALIQHNRPNYYLTLCDVPKHFTPAQELQLRIDLARSYEMEHGDGEFIVLEDGKVIDRRQIPV